MKKPFIIVITLLLLGVIGFVTLNNYIYTEKQGNSMTQQDSPTTSSQEFAVRPIEHASFVMTQGDVAIYVDPVGGQEKYKDLPEPTLILITDIHSDHMDVNTLVGLATERTVLVMPQAVSDELPESLPGVKDILANGETSNHNDIKIEAIPMYNIPESESAFHTKGRGNGYVVTIQGKRIYIAGDTSAIPEMKALQNIDVAFVPMNLPYTMTEEEAAEGVLAFRPEVVHPYHYRGQNGFSDVQKFKTLIEAKNSRISVQLLDFYPNSN